MKCSTFSPQYHVIHFTTTSGSDTPQGPPAPPWGGWGGQADFGGGWGGQKGRFSGIFELINMKLTKISEIQLKGGWGGQRSLSEPLVPMYTIHGKCNVKILNPKVKH